MRPEVEDLEFPRDSERPLGELVVCLTKLVCERIPRLERRLDRLSNDGLRIVEVLLE